MTAGFDPATASSRVEFAHLHDRARSSSPPTVSSRLLVEGGFSTNYERYNIITQPGITKERGTPEWYTDINKQDSALGTQWGAATVNVSGSYPDRFALPASMSYVTGAHNIKVGVQDTWGRYRHTRNANGDIRAIFRNGVPFQATILNTPRRSVRQARHADLGIYAQDSWTINRLTVNYGGAVRGFRAPASRAETSAGRPIRRRADVRADRHADLEERLAARRRRLRPVRQPEDRASKFSFGKYMQAGSTGFSESLQPARLQTHDRDLDRPERRRRAAGRARLRVPDSPAANSTSRSCRRASAWRTSAPSTRTSSGCTTSRPASASSTRCCRASRSRQAGTTASTTTCAAATTCCRRSPTTPRSRVYSPIDGTPITYYTSSAAKLSAVSLRGQERHSDRTMKYNGFEYNFNARLPRGITLFGGGMSERMLANVCDETVESEPAALLRPVPERPARSARSSRSRAPSRSATASTSASRSRACRAT